MRHGAFRQGFAAVKIVVCAWCKRTGTTDGWPTGHLDPPSSPEAVSHGICPACFAEHAPDITYPS
jgi:hypothetical protein